MVRWLRDCPLTCAWGRVEVAGKAVSRWPRRVQQLDCEHHSAACRGRSVTLVGAGGWWPDPQLD